MSQYDEDAGLAGDGLAELVEAGLITDYDALAYMAGDEAAREKVSGALAHYEPDVVEGCDVYGSLQ